MVRRKTSRPKKGTNTSQNRIKRTTKKRTKISNARRKVTTTTRPNEQIQRSVKKPGMVTSRSRKVVRNPNIKSNKSNRINKTGRATRKTTRTNPRKERSIYVKRSSGRQEKFDSHRMTQTVSRSGVPFLMARDITKKVVRKISRSQRNKEMNKSSKSTRNSNSQRNKNTKEVIIPGNEIRSMISKELRDRNRSDIAGSYEGQSPSNPRLERDESIDSTVPSLHNVTTTKTNIIHDKSKYGGA
jgi:transcriptional repressor NrdR